MEPHVSLPPHANPPQALQLPPWPAPAQQARQYASSYVPTHTLQSPQNSETSQRSPGLPVAVHIPPEQTYPTAQSQSPPHCDWGHVVPAGTQYCS
jgi:hypothetical protein